MTSGFLPRCNMASLVADYGASSGSESDSEETTEQTAIEVKHSEPEKPAVTDFFTAQDSESGDSDEETAKNGKKSVNDKELKLPNPFTDKLPNPLGVITSSHSNDLQGDISGKVFTNKYDIAEAAKHSILEQHVKMTVVDESQTKSTNRKVCHNFKRGKCRFGKKCKYSHGDPIPGQGFEQGDQSQAVTEDYGYYGNQYGFQGSGYQSTSQQEKPDEDSYMGQAMGKRKKPGVSNNLAPPKRAMKALESQRAQERPWTMNE